MKKKSVKRKANLNNKFYIILLLVCALVSVFIYKLVTLPNYIETTDSTGTFSFEYPDDWVAEPYVWEMGGDGPRPKEPDWSKQSQPITLHPADNQKAVVTLNVTKYSKDTWQDFDALTASVKEDYFAKVLLEARIVGDHRVLFTRVDYLGPPDAKVESFTDHRYYYDVGNSVLSVEFREKYHHDWPDDETGPDIDNSKYLADFEDIAHSVSFTKL